MKHSARNLVIALIVACLGVIQIHSQTQSPEKTDGPVVDELLSSASRTPGRVPVFDSNPRRLTNSPITIRSGNVDIGGDSGFVINGANGLVTFASGQTFPVSGFPNLGGEVTGPLATTVVSGAVAADVANAIVRRDNAGNFAAGSIALSGTLALPLTGVVTFGGNLFMHNSGLSNTFLGIGAGNLTITGGNNTGVGLNALGSTTTGQSNVAFGTDALSFNTTGNGNAAFGDGALHFTTTGTGNAAFGVTALYLNKTGIFNTAVGDSALSSNTESNNAAFGTNALSLNTTGSGNTALGTGTLENLVSGIENVALGNGAGINLNGSESFDIDLYSPGVAGESSTIRIGRSPNQTATFIAGINGATKQDIADLGAESDVLMKLRPVAFYYKPELDSTHTRQYGLVAEEVAQVAPGLVVFDQDGKPQTVRYHFVNAMLLNEVQKQERLIEAQQRKNEEQRSTIAQQQVEIEAMQSQLKEFMLRLAAVEKSVPSGTQLASAQK